MNAQRKIGIVLPLLLAGSLVSLNPASAQVVVGGTSTPTFFPFGADAPTATSPNYAGEFQQIYNASAFSTPVAITQIAFSSASDSSGIGLSVPETATYNLVIGFSNTSASSTSPSTTFANNIGSNFITVFSGTVTANLQANNVFDLNIPFMTPFIYVPNLPGQQNLLLDVFVNSAKSDQTDLFQAGPGLASEVYYSNGTPSSPVKTDQNGLLTQFTVTPVAAPEPSSVLSLLLGIGGVALACGLKAVRRSKQIA